MEVRPLRLGEIHEEFHCIRTRLRCRQCFRSRRHVDDRQRRLRHGSRGDLPPKSADLVRRFLGAGLYDGIWMNGMLSRWQAFEAALPTEDALTPQHLKDARDARENDRQRVASLLLRTEE